MIKYFNSQFKNNEDIITENGIEYWVVLSKTKGHYLKSISSYD